MWGLFDLNFQDLRPHIDVFEVFAAAESYYVMLDWNFNRRIHAQHDKKSRSNFTKFSKQRNTLHSYPQSKIGGGVRRKDNLYLKKLVNSILHHNFWALWNKKESSVHKTK